MTPIIVRVIQKTIIVTQTEEDRAFVSVYVDGKTDAAFPHRSVAEAIVLAEILAFEMPSGVRRP